MSSTGAKDRDPMTAALDYGEARREQLSWRRRYSAYRCEEADDETPACYFGLESEIEHWCESCQRRQPLYRQWRSSLKGEKAALRRLQSALVRAQEGR